SPSPPPSLPPHISLLSLHDALPICGPAPSTVQGGGNPARLSPRSSRARLGALRRLGKARISRSPRRRSNTTPAGAIRLYGTSRTDRKSTRLNSSHEWISYAVFCLKK